MTDPLNATTHMRKAERALATARLAFNAGDSDGTCNRAYYAMYDAAHAALHAVGAEMPGQPIKSHSGLVGLFGQRLVLRGHLDAAHGVAFNTVLTLRMVADYQGGPVSIDKAAQAVEFAEAFVAAIKEKFSL